MLRHLRTVTWAVGSRRTFFWTQVASLTTCQVMKQFTPFKSVIWLWLLLQEPSGMARKHLYDATYIPPTILCLWKMSYAIKHKNSPLSYLVVEIMDIIFEKLLDGKKKKMPMNWHFACLLTLRVFWKGSHTIRLIFVRVYSFWMLDQEFNLVHTWK